MTRTKRERRAAIRPAAEAMEGRALLTGILNGIATTAIAGVATTTEVAVLAESFPPASTGAQVAISWGDGTPPTFGYVGTPTFVGNQVLTPVIGSHGYAVAGTFPVTVNVIEFGGASLYQATKVAVSANPAGASGVAVVAPVGQTINDYPIARFLTPLATSSITSPTTVLIDWGDGSPETAGSLVNSPYPGNPGAVVSIGSHMYASRGVFIATINLATPNGNSAGIASTVVTVG